MRSGRDRIFTQNSNTELVILCDYFSIAPSFSQENPEQTGDAPPESHSVEAKSEAGPELILIDSLKQPSRQDKAPPQHSTVWRLTKRFFSRLLDLGNKLLNLLRHYASWVSFLQTITSTLLQKIPAAVLRATDYISPIGRIVSGLKLLNSSLFHFQGGWTRALCLVAGIGGVGLGIAALLWPAFGWNFAIANISSNAVLGLWFLTVALKNKFLGHWKQEREQLKAEQAEFFGLLGQSKNLEKYKLFRNKNPHALQDETNFHLSELERRIIQRTNQNSKLNADLAVKAYNIGIIFIALAGIILASFPPTLMIGASFLLATSIHGVLFGYDLSGKWPEKVQDYFFGPRSSYSDEELDDKVTTYKQKALSSTATAQRTFHRKPKNKASTVDPLAQEPVTPEQQRKKRPATSRSSCCSASMWRRWTNQQPARAESFQPAGTYLDIMPLR